MSGEQEKGPNVKCMGAAGAQKKQRGKKVETADAPPVLIFHSCANFWFLSALKTSFCLFLWNLLAFS